MITNWYQTHSGVGKLGITKELTLGINIELKENVSN